MSKKKPESASFANNPFRSQLQQVGLSKKPAVKSGASHPKPTQHEENKHPLSHKNKITPPPSSMVDPQHSMSSEDVLSSNAPTNFMEISDEDLFLQAMTDVVQFTQEYPVPEPTLLGARSYPSPEDTVRQELEKLIAGEVEFDMSQHEEFIEGAVHGLDPRVVQKLRRGEFSWQGHLDLHGCRLEEARIVLEHFVIEQRRKHHRCLLLVHGRGLHSPDKEPVLKQQIVRWLTRGFLRKQVLAFVTARPQDGGPGAMYVLLRRL